MAVFNKVILLDMDGVLANFVDGIITSLGLDVKHNDWASWDYHRELGFTDGEC